MTQGDEVRVLAPFADAFPDTYTVDRVDALDGQIVVFLVDIESAFSPLYLEDVK